VEFPCGEGIAIHIGPEPCAGVREDIGEASAGEGNMDGRDIASAWTIRRGHRPWHVQTLLAWEPGDLTVDRSAIAAGPHREGEEP
jgi:hypothetical protein